MKPRRLILPSAVGLGLTLALLWTLGSQPRPARADPNVRYVAPTGTDDGGGCTASPCRTVQYAVNAATDGDIIYVAGGTYTGTGTAVITITKSITIYGGWDGVSTGPVVRNPISYPTALDGENSRRVAYITGTVAPVLDGLTLQRGNAAGLGGELTMAGHDFGGAVYSNNASPVITNCRIVSSTAGFGAGLSLYYGAPTVGNSVVLTNTASQIIGPGMRGVGGGIFLYHSPAIIEGNVVMSNVAVGDHAQYDGGGGLYLDGSAAVVRNNTIQGNSARYLGGGLYMYQSAATVSGNTILNNNAWSYGGGAFMLLSPAALEANRILENAATFGGGALNIGGCSPFTLTNNIIGRNYTSGTAAALHVARFKESPLSPEYPSQGTLLHNTFADNNSAAAPWMIQVGLTTTVAFTNTIIEVPGGITVTTGSAVTLDTTMWEPSFLSQPGLAVSGGGTVVSTTNYYSETRLIRATFHLGPDSPAIDLAADAGVMTDVDGDGRPKGAGYDIGADEYYPHIFLPLVLRQFP
jgi:hypothetical protein